MMIEQRKNYQIFGAIISFLLLVYFAITSAFHPVNLNQLAHPYPDLDANLIEQIRCQMKVLPANGQIGYIIRLDGSIQEFKNPVIGYQFFLSQNLLAPLVLDKSSNHKWIIANLIDPAEMDQIASQLNAVLVKKCGENSAVFERTTFP